MKIALDVATRMGVVYYNGDTFFCTTYEGTPIEQLEMLQDVIGDTLKGSLVYIEQENTFRNANTTRSILHRVGYLKNSLERMGAEVKFINAMSARKHLGVKGKKEVEGLFATHKINADESDALAILLFGEGLPLDAVEGKIQKMGD